MVEAELILIWFYVNTGRVGGTYNHFVVFQFAPLCALFFYNLVSSVFCIPICAGCWEIFYFANCWLHLPLSDPPQILMMFSVLYSIGSPGWCSSKIGGYCCFCRCCCHWRSHNEQFCQKVAGTCIQYHLLSPNLVPQTHWTVETKAEPETMGTCCITCEVPIVEKDCLTAWHSTTLENGYKWKAANITPPHKNILTPKV